jgi:hypothetical protein
MDMSGTLHCSLSMKHFENNGFTSKAEAGFEPATACLEGRNYIRKSCIAIVAKLQYSDSNPDSKPHESQRKTAHSDEHKML